MSFIIDQTVLSIKLTNAGRELMAKGELNFSKFAVGDSEIDYDFIRENPDFNPEDTTLLRPFSDDPDITNFILKRPTEENINDLRTPIDNEVTTVSNTIEPRGVNDITNNRYFNDPLHVKQSSAAVDNTTVSGGKDLSLVQADDYGSNGNEPVAGDYLFIKWSSPEYTGETASNLECTNNIVQLTYKIITVNSGTLAGDNLNVTLDRNLPDFNSNGVGTSRVLIYPNNNNVFTEGDAVQSYYGVGNPIDFLFSFYENYDTPTIKIPVWNMVIIYSKEIEGVQSGNKKFNELPSKDFFGFIQYIERLDPIFENIGVIHYTNLSSANIYGEGFWFEEDIESRLPKLIIPHVMWYNNTLATDRLEIRTDFSSEGIYPDLETRYFNLIDNGEVPIVVGKVFPALKLFVIEDQELLAALSYKSNRNWTLPSASANFNFTLCEPVTTTTTTTAAPTTTTTTTTTAAPTTTTTTTTTAAPTTTTTTAAPTTTTTTTTTAAPTTELPPCCPRNEDIAGMGRSGQGGTNEEIKISFAGNINTGLSPSFENDCVEVFNNATVVGGNINLIFSDFAQFATDVPVNSVTVTNVGPQVSGGIILDIAGTLIYNRSIYEITLASTVISCEMFIRFEIDRFGDIAILESSITGTTI